MSQLQKDIIQSILTTLEKKGEVSIKGIGLFSLHTNHALLDPTKSNFLPPQKYISLDSEAIAEDKELSEIFAFQKNINIFEAKTILENWANELLHQLKDNGSSISIENFGILSREQDKIYFQNKIESEDNFGLQKLQFQPILKSDYSEKNTIIQKNIEETELTKFQDKKKKFPWWILAAVFTFLLIFLIPFQLFFSEYTPSWIQDQIDEYKGIEKKEILFSQSAIFNYFENNFYSSFPQPNQSDTVKNRTIIIDHIDTITTTIKKNSVTKQGINPIYISNDSEILNARLAKLRSRYATESNSSAAEQNTKLPHIPKGHYYILHETIKLEDGFRVQNKLLADGLKAYIFPGENGLIYVATPVKTTETLALQNEYFKDRYGFEPRIKEVIK